MRCTFCGVTNEEFERIGVDWDVVATHEESGLPTCSERECIEQADAIVAGEMAMRPARLVRYWRDRLGGCLRIAGRDWIGGMRQAHRFGHSETENESQERADTVRFLTRVAR